MSSNSKGFDEILRDFTVFHGILRDFKKFFKVFPEFKDIFQRILRDFKFC